VCDAATWCVLHTVPFSTKAGAGVGLDGASNPFPPLPQPCNTFVERPTARGRIDPYWTLILLWVGGGSGSFVVVCCTWVPGFRVDPDCWQGGRVVVHACLRWDVMCSGIARMCSDLCTYRHRCTSTHPTTLLNTRTLPPSPPPTPTHPPPTFTHPSILEGGMPCVLYHSTSLTLPSAICFSLMWCYSR